MRTRSRSRLRAAGAIPFGKLSLHEFAIGGPSFDLPFPSGAQFRGTAIIIPAARRRVPATALAAGFLPLALGTDTGGSIRNPAGNCGVAGLETDVRPRVAARRVSARVHARPIGPMARTVRRYRRWRSTYRRATTPPIPAARQFLGQFRRRSGTRRTRSARGIRAAFPRTGRAGSSRSNGRARGGRETIHARRRIGPRPPVAAPAGACRSVAHNSCSPSRGRCTRRGCATGPGLRQKRRAAN